MGGRERVSGVIERLGSNECAQAEPPRSNMETWPPWRPAGWNLDYSPGPGWHPIVDSDPRPRDPRSPPRDPRPRVQPRARPVYDPKAAQQIIDECNEWGERRRMSMHDKPSEAFRP